MKVICLRAICAILAVSIALPVTAATGEDIASQINIEYEMFKLDNGLMTDAEIDGPVAAFINLFNGKRTVRECIVEFAGVTDADPDHLGVDLLAIVRVFVEARIV